MYTPRLTHLIRSIKKGRISLWNDEVITKDKRVRSIVKY